MKKTKQKKQEKMFDLVIYMKTISLFYIQNKTYGNRLFALVI